jgi:hypothetical protein
MIFGCFTSAELAIETAKKAHVAKTTRQWMRLLLCTFLKDTRFTDRIDFNWNFMDGWVDMGFMSRFIFEWRNLCVPPSSLRGNHDFICISNDDFGLIALRRRRLGFILFGQGRRRGVRNGCVGNRRQSGDWPIFTCQVICLYMGELISGQTLISSS